MDEAMLLSIANDVEFLKKPRGSSCLYNLPTSHNKTFNTNLDKSCHPLLVGSGIGRHFDLCEQLQYECS